MQSTDCPNPRQLQDFADGRLPAVLIDRVSDHLEACRDCQRELDRLEAKPPSTGPGRFSKLIRQAGQLPDEPPASSAGEHSEHELQALIAQTLTGATRSPAESSKPEPDDDQGRLGERPVDRREVRSSAGLSSPSVGQRIGHYEIREHLGSGALGAAYRAVHLPLQRQVVIKVLRPERRADADAVKRFSREMEAVGKLDHPNLVKATDAGEFDGHPFLVMEFHPGRTVAALAEGGSRLPPPDACEIVRQAAVGLAHAHQRRLIHRDIKPSNLLVGNDGIVRVLDLGLALFVEDPLEDVEPGDSQAVRERMTRYGTAVGTRAYMAPEQWVDSHSVDHRADVYSLGCVLAQLFDGRPPDLAREGDPESPAAGESMAHSVHAATREALRPVLKLMLAMDPGRRFQSAQEVADALAPYTRGADLTTLAREGARPDGEPRFAASEVGQRVQFAKGRGGAITNIRSLPPAARPRPVATPKPPPSASADARQEASGPPAWIWWSLAVGMLLVGVSGLLATQYLKRRAGTDATVNADGIRRSDPPPGAFGSDVPKMTAAKPDPAGPVLRLSGTGELRLVGSAPLLDEHETVTIEFWARADDGGGGSDRILLQRAAGADSWPRLGNPFAERSQWELTYQVTGRSSWYHWSEPTLTPGGMAIPGAPQSTHGPALGPAWRHVAVIVSPSQVRIFFDGQGAGSFSRLGHQGMWEAKRTGGDLVVGGSSRLAGGPGRELDIRQLRISREARYQPEGFDPPQQLVEDATTLVRLDFSDAEDNRVPTESSVEGRIRGGQWIDADAPPPLGPFGGPRLW